MPKKIIWVLLFLTFCFLLVLTSVTVMLPVYIESSLLPSLARKTGISRFIISRPLIGLSRTQTSVSIGDLKHPVLSISSLSADYSLPGLFSKKIHKISISGLELRLLYENNRLLLDDPELRDFLSSSSKQDNNTDQADGKLPFVLEQLTVEQSTIILRSPYGVFHLPFQARVDLNDPALEKAGKIDVHLLVRALEQNFSLQSHIDLVKRIGTMEISTEKLDLQAVSKYLTNMQGIMVRGSADISARASAGLSPFSLEEFEGHIALHDTVFQSGDVIFTPLNNKKNPEFSFTGTSKNKNMEGMVASSLPDLMITKENFSINLLSPSFKAEAISEDGNLSADALFSTTLQSDNENFTAGSPLFKIKAHAAQKTNSPLLMTGSAQITDISVAAPAAHLSISKGAINIPFSLPLAKSQKPGTLEVKKIIWKDLDIGGLTGKIEQKKDSLNITADIHSPLLPGFIAKASVVKNLSAKEEAPLTLQLTIPPYPLTNFSLRKIQPEAGQVTLSGFLSGQAIIYPGTKDMGTAEFSIADGSLSLPEKNISFSGIQTSISFPNLAEIRSSPRQHLSFTSARLQDIELEGGNIFFNLESADSIFIEQANVRWVDGSIDSYALRFSSKNMPEKMIFFCSRLKLSALLDQLGIKNVSGEGTVNGRIPVTIGRKKITFEDSFLYSTPGEGGIIKIGDADFLTQAIPANSPQFAQLDFAQSALRNFDYSWAKINLITEDDILVMQLKLDGKPAAPLPFSYDSQTGSFKRITPQNDKQGISHPIRLDANFRFPLDTFVDYNKSIKNLLQSIQ